MVLARANGNRHLGQLRQEVDRLFEDFFGRGAPVQRAVFPTRTFPALNVWEEQDNLIAEAELPGLSSQDVEVSVVGNELTIKGRRPAQDQDGVAYHRRERGVGEFARMVRLPVVIDADKVEASLHDGVLTIKLPKSEAAKPRKIQVTAS